MSLFSRNSCKNLKPFLKLQNISKYSYQTPISNIFTSEKDHRITQATDGYEMYDTYKSNINIPALGFGTWGVDTFSHDVMAKSVDYALKRGYRHFDLARVYGNEIELGYVFSDAFKNGIVKREELFLLNKVYNNEQENVRNVVEDSLKRLNLSYFDSFLIHWPSQNTPQTNPKLIFNENIFNNSYKELVLLQKEGIINSSGVSNCSIYKLNNLVNYCKNNNLLQPSINQIEIHPYFQQNYVKKYCWQNNIIVGGYMPLGSPERPFRHRRDDDPIVLENDVIKEIAKRNNLSPAQVVIRWHLDRNMVITPKGTEEWMIDQNIEALNAVIPEEDLNEIDLIDKNFRYCRGEFMLWDENQRWQEFWDNDDELWKGPQIFQDVIQEIQDESQIIN